MFTRTKHRANRLQKHLVKHGIKAERIHGNRSQPQRTEALAGFKSGKYRVLVATDIAARGIDIEALGHVVNFDVPKAPEDYIHRVGRTARAELTGDAFTFVAPEEEDELRGIERAIGRRLPRVTVPDFDYDARPERSSRCRWRSGSRDPGEEGGGPGPGQDQGGAARGARGGRTGAPRRPARAREARACSGQGRPAWRRATGSWPAAGRARAGTGSLGRSAETGG